MSDINKAHTDSELVKRAQLGDEDSLNLLAEWARPELSAYVYRITLQPELTQEIVQESMLEMFKVLGKLENRSFLALAVQNRSK